MTEESIFLEAIRMHDPGERAAFLDRVCGPSGAARAELDELIAAHFTGSQMLDRVIIAPYETTGSWHDRTHPTHPMGVPSGGVTGQLLGKYKLLEKLGEGGMGTVWMADQEFPVRRRVAIKLVRGSIDCRQVLARFEAERQALALMDHPNIAKVLDAGATELGVPYFVMELVKGRPLSEYCDSHQLTVPERLDLFQSVCRAVQHAHQKGIIHRDLKPSNILVESHDGRPVVKVIDFGLAKAVKSTLSLTDKTLFTAFGMVLGTPTYMSPEQATFNALDVDTRADVYSLGVILYELLTGTTPIDRDDIRPDLLDHLFERIRTEEPLKPSSRLSSTAKAPDIARGRSSDPKTLGLMLRGDLDWIVMKALNKKRDRRYETPAAFADDVARYLKDDPVLAGPDSMTYRVVKFVKRYRRQVMVGGLLVGLLFGGLLGTAVGFVQARRSAAAADAARRSADRQRELADEAKNLAVQEAEIAREVLKFFNTQFLTASTPWMAATSRVQPLPNPRAKEMLERAAAAVPTAFPNSPHVEAPIRDALGYGFLGVGNTASAIKNFDRAVQLFRATNGPDSPHQVWSERGIALAHLMGGRYDKANDVLTRLRSLPVFAGLPADRRQSIEYMAVVAQAMSPTDDGTPPDFDALERRSDLTPTVKFDLGVLRAESLSSAGKFAEALAILEPMKSEPVIRDESYWFGIVYLNDYSTALRGVGRLVEAESASRDAVRLARRICDDADPIMLLTRGTLANVLMAKNQPEEAVAEFEPVLAACRRVLEPANQFYTTTLNNLAVAYIRSGTPAKAEPLFAEVAVTFGRQYGPAAPPTLNARGGVAHCWLRAGNFAGAEVELAGVVAEFEKRLPKSVLTPYYRLLHGLAKAGLRHPDAETVIVSGAEGVLARLPVIPPQDRWMAGYVVDKVVEYYTAAGRPDDARRWADRRPLELLPPPRRRP